jgi:Arc-like DNA binding domain.
MSGKYKNPHYALRIPRDQLEKIKYIAEANARSGNREIELLIRKRIEEYERENGEIVLTEVE